MRNHYTLIGQSITDAVGDAADVHVIRSMLHVSDAPMIGKVGREEIYLDSR